MRESWEGGEPSDSDLVARYLDGDDRAFALLAIRYRSTILSACRSAGQRDIDDAAQEALLAIARGLQSYRGEAPLQAWIRRVARNAASRSHSRARRAPMPVDTFSLAPTPEDDMTPAHILHSVVVEAVAALPAHEREAYLLRTQQQMSDADIAARLVIAPATVRIRVMRARARIRTAIEGAG